MACQNCAQKTLSLFIRSFANIEPALARRQPVFQQWQQSRFLSDERRPRKFPRAEQAFSGPPTAARSDDIDDSLSGEAGIEDGLSGEVTYRRERPAWQVQKEALKEKLGGEAWNPRKRLSPDTMEGIRHLHTTQPDKFTTPILANYFKVSPEAIRRILKSKWRPSDEEAEERMQRWDKRGERIWSNLVEMGVKPPKRWREMGVGRAQNGERPKWKSRNRNLVDVRDSVKDDFTGYAPDEDIIPTVDSSGKRKPITSSVPLSERL